jgi:hypothetical protein
MDDRIEEANAEFKEQLINDKNILNKLLNEGKDTGEKSFKEISKSFFLA